MDTTGYILLRDIYGGVYVLFCKKHTWHKNKYYYLFYFSFLGSLHEFPCSVKMCYYGYKPYNRHINQNEACQEKITLGFMYSSLCEFIPFA